MEGCRTQTREKEECSKWNLKPATVYWLDVGLWLTRPASTCQIISSMKYSLKSRKKDIEYHRITFLIGKKKKLVVKVDDSYHFYMKAYKSTRHYVYFTAIVATNCAQKQFLPTNLCGHRTSFAHQQSLQALLFIRSSSSWFSSSHYSRKT